MSSLNLKRLSAEIEQDPEKAKQIHKLMLDVKHPMTYEQARRKVNAPPPPSTPDQVKKAGIGGKGMSMEQVQQKMSEFWSRHLQAKEEGNEKLAAHALQMWMKLKALLRGKKPEPPKEIPEWAKPRTGYPNTNGAATSFVNTKLAVRLDSSIQLRRVQDLAQELSAIGEPWTAKVAELVHSHDVKGLPLENVEQGLLALKKEIQTPKISSKLNLARIADTDIASAPQTVEVGPGRDMEIIQRDIELEQAAIDEYQGQLPDASPKLKEVLEHLILEEQEHRAELEQLKTQWSEEN